MVKTTEQKYQKKDLREHILTRPDSYIGSVKSVTDELYVMNEGRMEKRVLTYVPGLYKIFDEILVNAMDHSINDKTVTQIKVVIEGDEISVYNDGSGVIVEKHKEYGIYIPELIFGNLLTSSNYDDTEQRVTGGKNGLGSKCIWILTSVMLYNGEKKLAKNIMIGDELIGDDGTVRTVKNITRGKGKMYEVIQHYGDNYKVNDNHTLTLHMPDHKVIFWSTNGWKVLWWNNKEKRIQNKFFSAFQNKLQCEECKVYVNGTHISRHYKRVHKDKVYKGNRKKPTVIPDMSNKDIVEALKQIKIFVENIKEDSVFDINIQDYMKLNKTTQRRLAGVRGDCVDWEYTEVALDPYMLGLWLGDGYSTGYGISLNTKDDPEIIEYIEEWCSENDANLRKMGEYKYSFSSKSNPGKKAPLKKQLEEYNLVNNKHIPRDYLINSKEVRLEVLAGLIDTDGTACRDGTRIQISQGDPNKKLFDDIVYLARSLGYCCSVTDKMAKYTWQGEVREKLAHILNISGNIDEIPTRVYRKWCDKPKKQNTDKTMGYIRIKEIPEDEYIGFEVDGNHRFVINDFTVTHNCTNVFSTKFIVETQDSVNMKKYIQKFENNMTIKNPPKITTIRNDKSYTKITFEPDFKQFGMKKLDEDIKKLIEKRVYDCAACTRKEVNVYFNGAMIKQKTFEKYVDLYIGNKKEAQRVYQIGGNGWEVACSMNNEDKFNQVSFVNGIWTMYGGKHVDYIQNQIAKKLTDLIQAKNKSLTVKPNYIKDRLFLFLKTTIINPSFSSQTKETLVTNVKEFGFKFDVSDEFITKLSKCGIVEEIIAFAKHKETRELKATDGKKKSRVKVQKLDDANWAGTSKSEQCTLILTEGDSAKTFAISGLSVVGRDKYGIYPLRGKVLNVREATTKKIMENKEITDLKTIIGLKEGKAYKSLEDLRYGKIMILTDADVDGYHIKGLIINMFHSSWPSLLKFPEFVTAMKTPIVKVSKRNTIQEFFTLTEYNQWKENTNTNGWSIKYYKGLGTSSAKEAKDYFKDLGNTIVVYKSDKDTDKSIKLAFEKKQADNRKRWLGEFDSNVIIENLDKSVGYTDFINKELIHFSVSDLKRSIPSVCDGLKPSQRKVLFYMLSKNITKEIKVSQLGGYISAETSYHHGPASMEGTIISMAQDYMGSNNMNFLEPIGQFGCLDPETDILLWDSTIKKAKDVKIGDVLVGDDGLQRRVLKLTQGVDEMYKIKPKSKRNLEYIVNKEHILTLKYSNHKKLRWNNNSKSWVLSYFDKTRRNVVEKTFRTMESSNTKTTYNKISDTKECAKNKAFNLIKTIGNENIFDIKLDDYLKISNDNKRYLKTFTLNKVIEWEERDVIIPPYILGIWLGDGMSNGRGIATIDSDHLKELVIYLDKIHAELVHVKNTKGHENCTYDIRKKHYGNRIPIGSKNNSNRDCLGCKTSLKKLPICEWVYEFTETRKEEHCSGIYENGMKRDDLNPFVKLLKENGLYKNKHIPKNYIHNSYKNRMELLAGLVDTDGCVKYNGEIPIIEITQSYRLRHNMVLDIQKIANSLGYSTSISIYGKDNKTSKGYDMSTSVLRIFGNNLNLIPMRISRKKIKEYVKAKSDENCSSFEVEYIEKGKFVGWQVDKNERFVLGNFIVTHNSRLQAGKDSASSRYINTRLASVTTSIFHPDDSDILRYLEDDGLSIEPDWYIPIIPTVLVNGVEGIGTGYSSFIPCYNEKDIIRNLTSLMNDEPMVEMVPYYKGFKGEIVAVGENTYHSKGVYKKVNSTKIEITELPVGKATEDYKEFLESDNVEKFIKDYENHSTEEDVRFIVEFKNKDIMEAMITSGDIYKEMKLYKQFGTTNMNLFDRNNKIKKYSSTNEIIREFYEVRMEYYDKRKEYLTGLYKRQFDIAEARVRFIMAIIDDRLKVFKKKKSEIEEQLVTLIFPKIDMTGGNTPSYKYLTDMAIYNFSQEKIDELLKQKKEKKIQLEELMEKETDDMWIDDLDGYISKHMKK